MSMRTIRPTAAAALIMLRWAATTAAGAAVVALAGCVTLPDGIAFEMRAPSAEERQSFGKVAAAAAATSAQAAPGQERRDLDVRVLPLAHGQIIVSEAGGAMSLFFSLFATEYAPWVHAGIVAIEDGQAVVYEANGDFLPLPGLSPTSTIRGEVRRVGVDRFVRGKRIVGLYALPPQADRERFVAFAREQHQRATPFDPYFDSDDASALYCTELVARALAEAGTDRSEATPVRDDNASLARARDWLHLRSRGVYLAGRLVEPQYEVGRWSPDLSSAQIEAYFAVKRELHRRFDADARLGHLFVWTDKGLRLREGVAQFYRVALGAAAAPGLDAHAVPARVEQLARLYLGTGTTPDAAPLALTKPQWGGLQHPGAAQVTVR